MTKTVKLLRKLFPGMLHLCRLRSLTALNGQGVLRILVLKIHDEKVEKRIGVRFGTWNVGSISGRETEVCKELRKRKMDV